jgi:hypothetical protein
VALATSPEIATAPSFASTSHASAALSSSIVHVIVTVSVT